MSEVTGTRDGEFERSRTEQDMWGPNVWGVPDGFLPLLLRRRAGEHDGPVMHVARDDAGMAAIAEWLGFAAPEIEVVRFPAWDCLPYDRVSPNAAIVAERAGALTKLLTPSRHGRIILTTIAALIQRVPPRRAFEGQSLSVAPGETLDEAFLTELLIANGYSRTDTVMEPGEFAIRGNIFDLFPAGEPEPVRLDLFGDEVENIRRFDVTTQRSTGVMERLNLHPVAEYALDPASVSRFRTRYRESFGSAAMGDVVYENVSEQRRYPGLEHYLPLFHETMETLFDYVPNAFLSFDHQAPEAFLRRIEMIADHYEARRTPAREGEMPYRPLTPDQLYMDRVDLREALAKVQKALLSPFAKPDGASGIDAGGRPGPIFAPSTRDRAASADAGRESVFPNFAARVQAWAQERRASFVTAWSRGSRERIAHLLREHGMDCTICESWADIRKLGPGKGPRPSVGLLTIGLERGFVGGDMAFVSEQDLLGERIARPQRKRRKAEQFISEASEIAEGDLVVHQDYGIGRYEGLETVSVGTAPHDCLRLLYDGGQKLFLPVENIELLSRFGSEQNGVALDKLGGTAWQARKSKMKARIRDMAGELIRTAAGRALRDAPMLAPAEGLWDEFCARFPFIETEDQARAIGDVLEDMSAGRPMDRLVCGDVGFGKTEVALRAAFVAALSGVQVAVVVPTTLLARQHFRGFVSRFQGFPVRIGQLSRLATSKEASETRKGLADGTVDIVIGTHALLAKTIAFNNLGLLIIDEEQHFGVGHKEKLKALREDVHVLTLSATPLPRTLQLSLTGVREMSLIATPPTDRLAVRTFITPFDSVMIREAIQRERFRGGQIFCVVPRIDDMDRMAARLAEIVPDARTVQAHGRLTPAELERVMTEFSEGRYDVLLSTNIVESGLDMPAVNTLIIHRADMFGLGQLYQLRGRVGRGKQRGYAYLTWPQTHRLSAASEKRLEVMQTLDTLGAGFTLASHDLDLRGAGNLLGEEQSGHVKEVGIELYQQMLEDAVGEMRAHKERKRIEDTEWTPNIVLGLPVLIPETYVRDLPVRLGLYRRIAGLETEEDVEAMRAELVDRFGSLPGEVGNLLDVVIIKRLCRKAGAERLEAGPKGMVIGFRRNRFRNPAGLLGWVGKNAGAGAKIRPDHKLAIVREMTNAQRIGMAKKVVGVLVRLVERAETA